MPDAARRVLLQAADNPAEELLTGEVEQLEAQQPVHAAENAELAELSELAGAMAQRFVHGYTGHVPISSRRPNALFADGVYGRQPRVDIQVGTLVGLYRCGNASLDKQPMQHSYRACSTTYTCICGLATLH